jgi:exosortase/archaeosortase family protein
MQLRQYWPLLWRVAGVGAILLAEVLLRAALLGDTSDHLDYFRLPELLYSFLLIWGGAVATLTAVESSGQAQSVAAKLAGSRIAAGWLAAHFALVTPVVFPASVAAIPGAPFVLLQVVQHLLLAAAVLALALAMIPAPQWRILAGGSNRRSMVAMLVAAVALLAIRPAASFWEGAAAVTFRIVRVMLAPFYPELQLIPEQLLIVTETVEIHIDKSCSGLEGVALILVMCSGWLWYLRREFRFPRALLMLPVAAAFMFLLNSLRLALLSALAAEGHVGIATAGFHSQAGWMFFIGPSFLVAVLSRRITWLRSEPAATAPEPAPQADSPRRSDLGVAAAADRAAGHRHADRCDERGLRYAAMAAVTHRRDSAAALQGQLCVPRLALQLARHRGGHHRVRRVAAGLALAVARGGHAAGTGRTATTAAWLVDSEPCADRGAHRADSRGAGLPRLPHAPHPVSGLHRRADAGGQAQRIAVVIAAVRALARQLLVAGSIRWTGVRRDRDTHRTPGRSHRSACDGEWPAGAVGDRL